MPNVLNLMHPDFNITYNIYSLYYYVNAERTRVAIPTAKKGGCKTRAVAKLLFKGTVNIDYVIVLFQNRLNTSNISF